MLGVREQFRLNTLGMGGPDDGPTRRARLRDVTVIKDVNATVDFLKGHPGVDSERLGIVGFCMGEPSGLPNGGGQS
jgi:dienelactone hydrolase